MYDVGVARDLAARILGPPGRAAGNEHIALGGRRRAGRRDRRVPHGRTAGAGRRSRPRHDPLHGHRRVDGDGSDARRLGLVTARRAASRGGAEGARSLRGRGDRHRRRRLLRDSTGRRARFARAAFSMRSRRWASRSAPACTPERWNVFEARSRGASRSTSQLACQVLPEAERSSSLRRSATSSLDPVSTSRIAASTSSRGSMSRAVSTSRGATRGSRERAGRGPGRASAGSRRCRSCPTTGSFLGGVLGGSRRIGPGGESLFHRRRP